MTIRQYLDRFIANRMVYCAVKTVRSYAGSIKAFLAYCCEEDLCQVFTNQSVQPAQIFVQIKKVPQPAYICKSQDFHAPPGAQTLDTLMKRYLS